MSEDEKQTVIDLLSNAISRLNTDVDYSNMSDAENKSWIEIYKELLNNKKFGPPPGSHNRVWRNHLQHIKPYIEVFGLDRGRMESQKLRDQGR